MTDIYGGKDPRHIPNYSISDAARYLGIPGTTLRSWVRGRSYKTQQGTQLFEPLIELPDRRCQRLSFTNLIEAHVLRVIRVTHNVELSKVRAALSYLSRESETSHPLAQKEFKTDGIDLFVEFLGSLINVSRGGQFAMKGHLEGLLQRVEWDEDQLAARIFTGAAGVPLDPECRILIDPRISFGRPLIASTGVSTATVTDVFNAGDSLEEISEDYDCTIAQIQEAIWFESQLVAA